MLLGKLRIAVSKSKQDNLLAGQDRRPYMNLLLVNTKGDTCLCLLKTNQISHLIIFEETCLHFPFSNICLLFRMIRYYVMIFIRSVLSIES